MSIRPTPLKQSDDQPNDRGSAMILTLMVMALVTVLGTTVAVVSINNLQSSWRSRQSGAARSAADAGVAQAVSYLRGSGTGDLGCSPACGGNPWGNETSPAFVPMPGSGGQSYKAWIEAVAPYPANDPGVYRIHSTGAADGAASRAVTADVSISTTTSGVPKGIFARSVNGGGSASVTQQSVFSTSCVTGRSKIKIEGDPIDLAYGIPVAVHSSGIVSDSNGNKGCTTANSIHASKACNTSFPYDQDSRGGLLKSTDTECFNSKMTPPSGAWAKYYSTYDVNSDGTKDPSSLLRSADDMYSIFGFRPWLSQGYLDTLRMLAQSQGTYFTSSEPTVSTLPATTNSQVVLYFDLTKKASGDGGLVDIKKLDSKLGLKLAEFDRGPVHTTDGATCPAKSLTIVVEGGDVRLNGNAQLAATLIMTLGGEPYGTVMKANGTAKFIGTIFADTVDMTGNVNLALDECFLANAGPGLTEIAVTSYRENDRGLS